MNSFAKILLVQRFRKVTYYTIKVEGDELSLFGQFKEKHTVENRLKLNHILAWIKVIGIDYGAKGVYFRNEAETADTSALPPENPNWEPTYVEWDEESQTGQTNNLRLYTFRANDRVVFLFNGDIKTAETAQECDKVRPHFRLANRLTKLLEASFGNEIKWNNDQTDIIIEEGFELNW
ncbi:hypothetical protein [Algoriphagus sp. AK58]|uniref:hypothetical protein n=1 Tax=Algoriphagus sp. AK58 TaxID=1406877 RepID=UPI00164F128D|nr:hypothetical protein [Algoriphagus sp. AK58]MBC6368015.1 hypothetical protein [Algoriphagus sp. AK58]